MICRSSTSGIQRARSHERASFRIVGWACVILVTLAYESTAQADTVRVLAAGAAQGAVRAAEESLTRATGHRIDATFDTVGALRRRVEAGEVADVVILSADAIAGLVRADKLDEGSALVLGSVQVALAVRRGSAVPDISTVDALKRTLLAARSLAHADPARGATAGAHFDKVLQRLGIAHTVEPRLTVLPFGGDVIAGVADGRFEIGASQSSEIATHAGVALVGGLPEPFVHRTHYVAARAPAAGAPAAALLQVLRTLQEQGLLAATGFDPAH
jgi:molybdate transport system substrate-binding protein